MSNIFKELLLEAVANNRIISSMKQKTVNLIYYSGDKKSGVLAGFRSIEPFALGTTKGGNLCVLAWLRNDFSKTLKSDHPRPNDLIKWRIYRLDRIMSYQNTIQKFDTDLEFISKNRPKFNLAYRNLGSVIYKIDPSNPTK